MSDVRPTNNIKHARCLQVSAGPRSLPCWQGILLNSAGPGAAFLRAGPAPPPSRTPRKRGRGPWPCRECAVGREQKTTLDPPRLSPYLSRRRRVRPVQDFLRRALSAGGGGKAD